MAHEENFDGAGVEFDDHAPDSQTPHFVDAVVVDAVVEEPAPVAVAVANVNATANVNAPDFYAVGVRLIKMSPVWLLTATGGFALLLLVLSWVRPAGGKADAASIPNDAKSVKAVVVQYPEAPAAPVRPSQETPATAAETAAAPAKVERAEVVPETHEAEPVQAANATPSTPAAAPAQEKKQPASVVTSSNAAGGKFTIQVASFSVESQANERISSLRAAGFDAHSTAVEIPGRGRWFRVHVGRFGAREEASKVAAQLREKGAAASSMVVAIQE
jgi:cell division septation protein DedD